jgi:antitoxin ParD1/3/4
MVAGATGAAIAAGLSRRYRPSNAEKSGRWDHRQISSRCLWLIRPCIDGNVQWLPVFRAAGVKWERDPILPIFAIAVMVSRMGTMNISLPDHLKSFVDEQVAGRGYGTSSEYIRELIRRDQDRLVLRRLLLDGASSAGSEPVDGHYFSSLRDRARGRHSK